MEKEYIVKPVTSEGIVQSISNVIEDMNAERALRQVPHFHAEKLALQMENELWAGQEPLPEQSLTEFFERLGSIPEKYRKTAAEEVLELIARKAAERVGAELELALDRMPDGKGEKLREWFDASLSKIRRQLVRFKTDTYYQMMGQAKQYLAEHLQEEITLEDMARHAGISPTYFSQIFSESTGQTFVAYRIEIRMKKAMELLCRPDMLIKEVSDRVGYNDVNHFTRSFKKFSGLTPTEFRAKRGIG